MSQLNSGRMVKFSINSLKTGTSFGWKTAYSLLAVFFFQNKIVIICHPFSLKNWPQFPCQSVGRQTVGMHRFLLTSVQFSSHIWLHSGKTKNKQKIADVWFRLGPKPTWLSLGRLVGLELELKMKRPMTWKTFSFSTETFENTLNYFRMVNLTF